MTPQLVSIILPTHNERQNVLALIEGIGRVFDGIAYEIILMNEWQSALVIEESVKIDYRLGRRSGSGFQE